MRIYLAAAFDRQFEMRDKANQLASLGHDIVSTWLYEEVFSADCITSHVACEYAARDFREVQESELCIVFLESYPSDRPLSGGRLVEMGIALADCPIVYAVGPTENIFSCHPKVLRFETWEECFEFIDSEKFEEV